MTVPLHGPNTITTHTSDAPAGIVDAPQGMDSTSALEAPRFSSADPIIQGSGPLAVDAGQEAQRQSQQVSTRYLRGNTTPSVPSTSLPLSEHPRHQEPQLTHISSTLDPLDNTQPPTSQKRMLSTLIGGVSVYNDGLLHVPLHDLHGSNMPLRDHPMTPLYVNTPTTFVTRTTSHTQPPCIQNTTSPSLTSVLSLLPVRDVSGPLTAERGYPMTPLYANPPTTFVTRTTSHTQPLCIQNTTFSSLTSELSLLPVRDFSGPLTAERGYPVTPLVVNPILTHSTQIADTTQPPFTQNTASPPLTSELLLGFVGDFMGH